MNAVSIQVEKLGKLYRIGQSERYGSLRERLTQGFRSLLPNQHPAEKQNSYLWALKDISFNVDRGEVVGIIGRNGAGKSTLLKILSRITTPTEGRAAIYGRVGSLLDVGTGFHPELTGRENIFLNGAVLGMRSSEIRKKFDEIVEFSEVEKFLDTPVKHYSTGMYVRLAFAVAAHLEPDILIVDEVLAVGDAAFQKKSLGKMEAVGKGGRTVLFVSHNMELVSTLTTRCIVLDEGKIIYEGPTLNAIQEYFKRVDRAQPVYVSGPSPTEPTLTRVEVKTSEPNSLQMNGKAMDIVIEISAPRPLENASLSFHIVSSAQQPVVHLWSFDSERPMCRAKGVYRLVCHIPKARLYLGHYTLTVYFSERFGKRNSMKIEGICPFEVVMYGQPHDFGWRPGLCTYIEDCDWTISQSE